MYAIRTILPSDLERERQFVQRLSKQTRYRRLLGTLRSISERQLRALVEFDPNTSLALAAVVGAGDDQTFIGVARFAPLLESDWAARRAEFAIAIADEWQRRGVGSRLLSELIDHAAATGYRELYGDTFADNLAMLKLARRLGLRSTPNGDDTRLQRIYLALPPRAADDGAGLDGSLSGQVGARLDAALEAARGEHDPDHQ